MWNTKYAHSRVFCCCFLFLLLLLLLLLWWWWWWWWWLFCFLFVCLFVCFCLFVCLFDYIQSNVLGICSSCELSVICVSRTLQKVFRLKRFCFVLFCCCFCCCFCFRPTLPWKLTSPNIVLSFCLFLFCLSVACNAILGAVKLLFLMASKVSFVFSFAKKHTSKLHC